MRTLLTFITMLTCVVAISHAQGVSAHRGDNKNAPENTIPAILSAVKKGAHQIEFDVWPTKSNKYASQSGSQGKLLLFGQCRRYTAA